MFNKDQHRFNEWRFDFVFQKDALQVVAEVPCICFGWAAEAFRWLSVKKPLVSLTPDVGRVVFGFNHEEAIRADHNVVDIAPRVGEQ